MFGNEQCGRPARYLENAKTSRVFFRWLVCKKLFHGFMNTKIGMDGCQYEINSNMIENHNLNNYSEYTQLLILTNTKYFQIVALEILYVPIVLEDQISYLNQTLLKEHRGREIWTRLVG